jgi:hypothetical protein
MLLVYYARKEPPFPPKTINIIGAQ